MGSKRSFRIFRKVELRNYKIKVNNLFKTSTEIRIKSTIDQTCFRSQSFLLLKLLGYRGLSTWALIILIRSLFLESKSVGVFECGSGSSALWSLTNIVNQSYHPVTYLSSSEVILSSSELILSSNELIFSSSELIVPSN